MVINRILEQVGLCVCLWASVYFLSVCLMDGLGFYVPSTVFQSFRDDGRVNMKGSVQ